MPRSRSHLVALANQMVTEVRQRVTRTLLGRRGTIADPIWVNRRLLLTGADRLSTKQWNRLWRSFDASDPTKEIQAAWAVKERLRLLLLPPSRVRGLEERQPQYCRAFFGDRPARLGHRAGGPG
jgi:transposase